MVVLSDVLPFYKIIFLSVESIIIDFKVMVSEP